ncbi:class I SAM-dependent methyltransferase [Enterobacter cloacae]|uniref:class I SAM-dependent methyltransferase n=1 Tax=Enterobacter cloacae TaxID=550 RepID=UPI00317B5A40
METINMGSQVPAEQFSALADFYESMMDWPFREKVEIPSVKNVLGDISGLRILDFGCGSGFYTRMLHAMGAGYVAGYDASEGMLNYCRKNNSEDNIEYISTLNGQESRYDIVLAIYVLPYARTFAELCAMAEAMTSLLRPGGRLITLPLSPFYNTLEQFYAPYGFTLTSEMPYQNGEKVTLRFVNRPNDTPLTAWYWSQKAIHDAFQLAGLGDIRWRFPRADGYTDHALDNYTEHPHTLLAEGNRIK